jgi:hypothetical protein
MQKKGINIELSVADDVQSIIKKAEKLASDMDSSALEINKIKDAIDKMRTQSEKALAYYEASVQTLYKMGSELENLGVSPKESKLYNNGWKAINSVQSSAEYIKNTIKQIK